MTGNITEENEEVLAWFNHLMPGGNKKVTHFYYHQALKG